MCLFWWSMSMCPSHLVLRSGNQYQLEPYLPNRFTWQFDYDQFYISNPNLKLQFEKSWIDGSRAFWHFAMDYINASFLLPEKYHKLLMIDFLQVIFGYLRRVGHQLSSLHGKMIISYLELSFFLSNIKLDIKSLINNKTSWSRREFVVPFLEVRIFIVTDSRLLKKISWS